MVILPSNSGGICLCAEMNSSCVIFRMKCVILRMKCNKRDEHPWTWDDKRWLQVSCGNQHPHESYNTHSKVNGIKIVIQQVSWFERFDRLWSSPRASPHCCLITTHALFTTDCAKNRPWDTQMTPPWKFLTQFAIIVTLSSLAFPPFLFLVHTIQQALCDLICGVELLVLRVR